MSENQNRDLSRYDAMTTQELEEILRQDIQAPQEQETDTEIILYVMEVLTKRKYKNSHIGKTAQQAYDSFQQNYMPATENTDVPKGNTDSVTVRFPRWMRSLTAVAAAVVLLLLGTATAKAFGFDVWHTVVRWTQDTFQFGGTGTPQVHRNDNAPYTSLQDALKQGNISPEILTAWIPEGFTLTDINVEQTPVRTVYIAQYTNGERTLAITVRHYLNEEPVYAEQSSGLVEMCTVSGITYYLLENNGQVSAEWLVDFCECSISGDITLEELKRMINAEKG